MSLLERAHDPRRRRPRPLGPWQVLGLGVVLVALAVVLVEVAAAEGWPRGVVAVAGGVGAAVVTGWLVERLGDP